MTIEELIKMAVAAARKSVHPRTQVGCAAIDRKGALHTNWNHEARKVHAEHMCRGLDLRGKPLVCTWAACPDCAALIVGAMPSEVWTSERCHIRTPDRWREKVETGLTMIRSAGIPVYFYTQESRGPITFDSQSLHL